MPEIPSFYVWPEGYQEGDEMPYGFSTRVAEALKNAGFESEPV